MYRPQNNQDDQVVFRTAHESFKSTEVQSPFYIDLDHNKSSIDGNFTDFLLLVKISTEKKCF